MTTLQLHLANALYSVFLIAVVVLTRATARRVAGAMAGGAVFGTVVLGGMALGEEVGWWRIAITWEPYFLTLLFVDAVISCAPIYLVTWRVVRRFGWRGLAVVVVVLVVLGPMRDYRFMASHPEWGSRPFESILSCLTRAPGPARPDHSGRHARVRSPQKQPLPAVPYQLRAGPTPITCYHPSQSPNTGEVH